MDEISFSDQVAVRDYFQMKDRAEQLRRELRITNQMLRNAEDQLRHAGIVTNEYLTWSN